MDEAICKCDNHIMQGDQVVDHVTRTQANHVMVANDVVGRVCSDFAEA